MRRLALFIAATFIVAACAHMAPPPGGPKRTVPIKLLGTVPESLVASPGFRGNAEFDFDEVVNEGTTPNFGRGTGDLERHVLLSPDTTVPIVQWHRDRITVRPRGGWRPGMVYWIELLPGITDLHNNTSKVIYRLSVVTGDTIPTRYISGRVIDWSANRAAAGALVTALHLPDSLRYRDLADSNGRFRLGPLPRGAYLIEGVIDQNSNHKRDGREMWDTLRAGVNVDSVGEIWVFLRDTMPPAAQDAAKTDSTTLTVNLKMPVDPNQQWPADSIRVGLLPDTVSVGPVGAWSKALADSLFKPPPPIRAIPKTAKDSQRVLDDSIKAITDSISRASKARVAAAGRPVRKEDPPQQKRLTLGTGIVVKTRGLLAPGSKYYVEIRGVRLASGIVGTVRALLDVPKVVPIDSTKLKNRADSTRADSTRVRSRPDTARTDSTRQPRPDSVRRRPDSLPRRPE